MFNLNKVSAKRGFFTATGFGSPNQAARRVITPEELLAFGALGFNRREVAAKLGLSYGYSNRRINESHSLSEAYKRGLALYGNSTRKI